MACLVGGPVRGVEEAQCGIYRAVVDASTLVNVVAIAVSLLALGLSTTLAIRQVRISRHANHVPAVLALLTEFRSVDFHDRHDFVTARLATTTTRGWVCRACRTTPAVRHWTWRITTRCSGR